MKFFLFTLVTATLFIRPGELFQALRGLEIFMFLIVPCLLLSVQSVLAQLSPQSIKSQPISLCVYGLLLAVPISNLVHFDLGAAGTEGLLCLKNVIYYLLLVSLVNTPSRFRWFLFWEWFFCFIFIGLAILQFKGLITLNMEETVVEKYGDMEVKRMTGSGSFGDPNDVCVAINMGIILSLYWMGDRLVPLPRLFYMAAVVIFGYGLMQTQSRGGFIALTVACGVMMLARYGWKQGAMLAAAGLPLLLVVFKGRITNISTQENTSHQRLEQWGAALEFFRSSPVFGIGANKFRELSALVAHNSYMHAYAELGYFGGTLFTGAFFIALLTLYRMNGVREKIADPNLQRALPFMTATMAGTATMLLTISHTYYMSTYMFFGMATAYLRVSNASKLAGFRVSAALIKSVVVMSIVFLAILYVFVRLFR